MMTNHIGTDSQDLAKRMTDLGIPVLDGTVSWRCTTCSPTGEGLDLLADYGVPVMRHAVVQDVDAAVSAADEMGYPVVMKTAVAGILHKSDVGGVVLNLADAAAVRDAYTDLRDRLGDDVLVVPHAAVDGT